MNKLNTKISLLLMLILMVASVSCKKLLDIPPQSKLTQDQFWKNRDQAVAAVAGIYATLGNSHWDLGTANVSNTDMSLVEAYIYWGEIRGDLLAAAPGKVPADQVSKENVDNLLVAPADVTTKYTHFYRIIDEANLAIKYIPNIVNLDPSLSKTEAAQLVGEAYFLRAYAYFWLVRTFKDVPLVLAASETDDQNYNIAKSTSDVILAQIMSDLTVARNTLPEWYTNTQYPRCRATQYTALAVLSDVELWTAATGKTAANNDALYDKVITNCDSVINSGRFILLPGSSYGSMFIAGNSSESIFETYSNALVNNQTNNINPWFSNYWVVPSITDNLFNSVNIPDYRGFATPGGPTPPAGSVVSYNITTRIVLKYNVTTNDARWIFYRYPDVLLMKAEALAHRYPDDVPHLQLACDMVNQVRSRAYGGVITYPKLIPTSTFDMDNALLDERAKEFIGEGKRWFDLMRFASRDNFAHPDLLTARVINSFPAVNQLIVAPRVSDPDSWYLPLNQAAIDASAGKLIQNKYYQ